MSMDKKSIVVLSKNETLFETRKYGKQKQGIIT